MPVTMFQNKAWKKKKMPLAVQKHCGRMNRQTIRGSTDSLLYDWLRYIHEVNRTSERIIEDGKQFWIPFMAIPPPLVKELFEISKICDLAPNTRYIALYLYDKFSCNNFWESYMSGIDGKGSSTSTWEQVCKRISSQAKLRLMSCIQIASKIDSHTTGLGISQVIAILREIDEKQEYTPNTIFSSEFKVFKTVGFKIPLVTPLDCSEILLAITGLDKNPQIFGIVVHLLDLSFLQHNQLYSNLQFMINGRCAQTEKEKKNFMAMEINSLYLGGSVVLCAGILCGWTRKVVKGLARELADLVEINENDLRVMSDILFAMAVQVENKKD